MRYNKSLDPKHIDDDGFAQKILETLIDKKYIIDSDKAKRVDYINNIKTEIESEKYNL